MPCLKIFTSIAKDKIPENFAHKLVPLLSKLLNKPEEKFYVVVSADCVMSMGGTPTTRPGAIATLESIGSMGLQENQNTIKEITNFVFRELGIAPIDFVLSFYDLDSMNIGRGGKTAAQLYAENN